MTDKPRQACCGPGLTNVESHAAALLCSHAPTHVGAQGTLVGFGKVVLQPGEEAPVRVPVAASTLRCVIYHGMRLARDL